MQRWRGKGGGEPKEDFRKEFKEFYGQGWKRDCCLDLDGVKLFLLLPLTISLSPIRVVRSSKKKKVLPWPFLSKGDELTG